MQDFLAAFRSTPGEDGMSPAELLRGWKMRMRMSHQVLPASSFEKKETLQKADSVFEREILKIDLRQRQHVVRARFRNRRDWEDGRSYSETTIPPRRLGQSKKAQEPNPEGTKPVQRNSESRANHGWMAFLCLE